MGKEYLLGRTESSVETVSHFRPRVIRSRRSIPVEGADTHPSGGALHDDHGDVHGHGDESKSLVEAHRPGSHVARQCGANGEFQDAT